MNRRHRSELVARGFRPTPIHEIRYACCNQDCPENGLVKCVTPVAVAQKLLAMPRVICAMCGHDVPVVVAGEST